MIAEKPPKLLNGKFVKGGARLVYRLATLDEVAREVDLIFSEI